MAGSLGRNPSSAAAVRYAQYTSPYR
ncbi:MAG: hypothetical protein K0S37_4870, partial [Microbacterium sp.]|nr:hypothetical protein [Microbacterium sp.]